MPAEFSDQKDYVDAYVETQDDEGDKQVETNVYPVKDSACHLTVARDHIVDGFRFCQTEEQL
jgi:hypothetical protein